MKNEIRTRGPSSISFRNDEKKQSSKRTGKATDEILVGRYHTYEW
jgi:hypothetical protein